MSAHSVLHWSVLGSRRPSCCPCSGLTRLLAATANLIATLEPAMTAGLAFLFLGERLTGPQLLGGSLILTGVVLLRLGDRAMQAARVAPPPSQS